MRAIINNSRVGIAGSYIIGFLLRTLKKATFSGLILAVSSQKLIMRVTLIIDFPVPCDLLPGAFY